MSKDLSLYNISGFCLLSPIHSILAYDATNRSELGIFVDKRLISIDFTNISKTPSSNGIRPLCVVERAPCGADGVVGGAEEEEEDLLVVMEMPRSLSWLPAEQISAGTENMELQAIKDTAISYTVQVALDAVKSCLQISGVGLFREVNVNVKIHKPIDFGLSEIPDGVTFQMHDLMHDLAHSVMENEYCVVHNGKSKDISPRTRHVSSDGLGILAASLTKAQMLRTYVICPEMASLPKELQRLSALKQLSIDGCPALEIRCKKDIGEDWDKIKHIPDMRIGTDRKGLMELS
ncbi:GIY-YIG nuclease superfamily [Cinnamomum micranthum f. kanehirae]|uniref:GIY-YIG nuclease superfamily n=1 Tax=Cinnamomum micranthum f. kanehirae TaxID=337451 RepID=A0A3S3MVV9_9MAGN|nr:GIY-YIG nuclease superfamily [Cinnamomum micranthum f. kanehirae]